MFSNSSNSCKKYDSEWGLSTQKSIFEYVHSPLKLLLQNLKLGFGKTKKTQPEKMPKKV